MTIDYAEPVKIKRTVLENAFWGELHDLLTKPYECGRVGRDTSELTRFLHTLASKYPIEGYPSADCFLIETYEKITKTNPKWRYLHYEDGRISLI